MNSPLHRLPSAAAETGAGSGWWARLASRFSRLSDTRAVLVAAFGLFVLGAWPLLLVDLPPLQDLPNHLATAHIIARPDLYPQYAFNGFLKSNSLLTLWLHLAGDEHLLAAGRAFAALVLALHAIALPVFALRFAGRRGLGTAMLFAWPLVHHFFVAMGMLNFSFAFALSLIVFVLLDQQRERPQGRRALLLTLLSGVLWYAHPFPLVVVLAVGGLFTIRLPAWKERARMALHLLAPLAPVAILSFAAARRHLVKAERPPDLVTAFASYLPPWETAAHLWLDASGALTWLGSTTVVPALLLAVLAWQGRRAVRPLLSGAALVALLLGYAALPVTLSNWCYFNCRLIPFVWALALVRVPQRLPQWISGVLVGCAVWFSVALAIDYVRLDRDRAAFAAGMDAVAPRAALLPLLFQHQRASTFTASLTHAWAYYVLAKDTTAPLVFAVERSYPITYRTFPPAALIPPALDEFAEKHATAAKTCGIAPARVDKDCLSSWRGQWSQFWQLAEPRFTHVLTWAMPQDAASLVPTSYRRTFRRGQLEVFERTASMTPPALEGDRRD